uniref:Lon proteolytic domain-containing protein n=1 Tax=viral metagenome TaxID=1070528 RepID=A0A6C0KHS6_9ZZZZ
MKNQKSNNSLKTNFKKDAQSLVLASINHKISMYETIIHKTIISIQKNKRLDILNSNEMHLAMKNIEEISEDIIKIKQMNELNKKKSNYDDIINRLQIINTQLSSLFKLYGTENIEDLLVICFGNVYIDSQLTENNKDTWDIIKKIVHPVSYKLMSWKLPIVSPVKKDVNFKVSFAKNKIVEDFMIVDEAETFECFDLARTITLYYSKVYGIKIAFQNIIEQKTILVSGLVDDIYLNCYDHIFIKSKLESLILNTPIDDEFNTTDFQRFTDSLTIKELLIYNTKELYNRYIGYINQACLMKQKTISNVVKDFLNMELYGQRTAIIQLLLKHDNAEFQYLAYLLYDLLSSDSNGHIDTTDQTKLYDSLPWKVKQYFKDAMKTTVKYTNDLSNFDNTKIPLEQLICLMNVSDNIKEKAIIKLKEVKAKSEDTGSKARQYLEGLLKIPFGIYKKENILDIIKDLRIDFKTYIHKIANFLEDDICIKEQYSLLEINKYNTILKEKYISKFNEEFIKSIYTLYINCKRDGLISNIFYINTIIKKYCLITHKLNHSGKKNDYMKENIRSFITDYSDNTFILTELRNKYKHNDDNNGLELGNQLDKYKSSHCEVIESLKYVNSVLDKSVYGHKNAKRQIERIIGQWMNGEQIGHCFGFEGPPGLGKTTLAKKGLAYCLKDDKNGSRPFSFIAIGGSSNGSILDGHNYTYVGSTWGKIVDILIETKCMNPIVFIDELDKVSKTENGKEIIGILTHLVDSTQNDAFQDKYFSGIDLDLSKALFIFSYNDVSAVDRILLDRIHRIKFDPLTTTEKIIITRDYLLPEIFKNIDMGEVIQFTDDIIEYIIESYTAEAGVRKLKEILFEIVSEINLEVLHNDVLGFPIIINKEILKDKYLKDRHEIIPCKIAKTSEVGIINGLWANVLGKGGILSIETSFYLTSTFFDLKLTGMQGDVMKESMNVAKTLAWKLTSEKKQEKIIAQFEKSKLQGIHIHCPEGATPKDGPSAGAGITTCIYSLLNNLKIKNNMAITGEINLKGDVTEIGGLELKFVGGIKAGVTEFIYPKPNEKDFKKFMERYGKKEMLKGIKFYQVENISDVFKHVFVKKI